MVIYKHRNYINMIIIIQVMHRLMNVYLLQIMVVYDCMYPIYTNKTFHINYFYWVTEIRKLLCKFNSRKINV